MSVKINELWAYVSENEDGSEGIVALNIGENGSSMPLVGGDAEHMAMFQPFVEMLRDQKGVAAKLVKFTTREEVT